MAVTIANIKIEDHETKQGMNMDPYVCVEKPSFDISISGDAEDVSKLEEHPGVQDPA